MWLRCSYRIVFTLVIAAFPFIGFCQDLLPYPVGLYPLNNIHKTDDASCYANLGGTAEDAHLVTGPLSEPDTAYEFAGSSTSYIDIPQLQHFDDTSITILVWILQTGQAGSVFKYGNSDRGVGRCSSSMTYSLELYTSRTYSFSAQFVEPNGESVSLSNNTVTLVNKWHYAGVSYNHNSGTATLWIDGNDVQRKNLKKLKLCTDGKIRIGGREEEDKSFQGRISCLQIYDKELTTKEITAVKNRCFNGSQPPVDCTKASMRSCGVSMSTQSGTFSSPGYPTGYPYDTACKWDIKVPSGYIITLKFKVFNLEKSYSLWPECPDYVIVQDGINSWSKMLKSLCGGQTGWEEEIVSSGNVMRVEFNTDRERSAPGFTAEYTSMISKDLLPYPVGLYPLNNIHKTDDASCYANLGGTAEDAHLVKGPLSEPDTAYEFAGSSTSYIDIPQLQHFDVNTSITILVWILQTGQAGSVFKYGNSGRGVGRCSSTMTYSLELYTSRTYSFSAQFVEPNGESVSLSNNTVTLVNKWRYAGVSYNHNSGTATLWIDGNDVQRKKLKKLKLCTDGKIRIGGREEEDKSFQGRISCLQIYGKELTTKEITAVKNRCFNGSQPPVDCTKASMRSCGVSMSTQSGTFSSPGYPTGYPYDTACKWDIKVPSGYVITLKFKVFNLEKSYSLWPECPDYVIVQDGINSWSKMLKSLCGGQTGWEEEIVSSGNVMRVEFNTDTERSAPGFTAEYTSMISKDESDEKGLMDFSRHYTGIVIGVACAAIFAILVIMIFSHTRRRLRGNRSDTLTRRQSMPFSDNDVFQQNAPPTYDDVMRFPELYPPTPCQGSLANTPAATPRRGSPVSTPTLPHRLLNPPRSPALIPKVGTPIGMPLLNTWRGSSTPPSTSRVSLQRGISPLARAELTPQHSRPADHLSSDEQEGDEDDEELPPYPGIVNVASVLNQVRETLELSRLATRQTSNPSLSDSSNSSDSNDNRTVGGQRRPRDTRAAVMDNTGDVQTSLEPNRVQSGDNNTGGLGNPWVSSKVARVAAPGRTLRSIESDV